MITFYLHHYRSRLRKEKLESITGDSEREYRTKMPHQPVPYYSPGMDYYDPTGSSGHYRQQRIAFYDNRAALDDYFEDWCQHMNWQELLAFS